MKDIGSIFPIDDPNVPAPQQSPKSPSSAANCLRGTLFTSLCREALLIAAQVNAKTNRSGHAKTVMLPAYTCETVATPFIQDGWDIHYYGITRDLTINPKAFRDILTAFRPSVLLVHPFYGIPFTDEELALIRQAREQGTYLIEDKTQDIFTPLDLTRFDCITGSLRKYCAIPDGAFLAFKSPSEQQQAEELICRTNPFHAFVDLQTKAMTLRATYFQNGNEDLKTESRILNKQANEIADGTIAPHRMADYSHAVISSLMTAENCRRRQQNYAYLDSQITFNQEIQRVYQTRRNTPTGPLYYPIYCRDRAKTQKTLCDHRIYAPILWQLMDPNMLVDDQVRYIYEHLLVLPVAQIYDQKDMEHIIAILETCR